MAGKGTTAHFAIVCLCLSFTFVWGIRHLKSDSIAPAEYNSIFNIYENHLAAQSTLAQTLQNVAMKDETHPPGYFLLLNVWSRLVGSDLLTLRVLSIYFGMFTLAFTFRLARRAGTGDQALDAVVLITFLAYFEFYIHEIRMYALLAMLSAWVVWSYSMVVNPHTRKRWFHLLSLGLSSAAIIYVHLFGFIMWAAIGAYHLLLVPKNRRWLQICLVMIGAFCLYLPWLPTTLQLLEIRTVYAGDRLAWHEALPALASIYTNGLSLLAPICGAILFLKRRRLTSGQVRIASLIVLIVVITLAANEVASIVVARRIRYTIVLAPLWACTLAIALDYLPIWKILRIPALVAWIIVFFLHSDSREQYLYTNSLDQNRHKIPHYQHLLYEPEINTRKSDFVLSFQNDIALGRKTLDYYGRQLSRWRGLIHIWNDADGIPSVQSTDTRYQDVQSMAIWNFPIWLIHNPQETDLQSMAVFAGSFSSRFHSCGRYLETDNSIVELYVKRLYPCDLLTSEQPLELHYENGTELANIEIQQVGDNLNVYLWWTNTIANQYSFSLQLFDSQGVKISQLDEVIGGDPLFHTSLEISDLPAGEYAAKLIVYDFETRESQSGMLVDGERRFQREVEVARIRISR